MLNSATLKAAGDRLLPACGMQTVHPRKQYSKRGEKLTLTRSTHTQQNSLLHQHQVHVNTTEPLFIHSQKQQKRTYHGGPEINILYIYWSTEY